MSMYASARSHHKNNPTFGARPFRRCAARAHLTLDEILKDRLHGRCVQNLFEAMNAAAGKIFAQGFGGYAEVEEHTTAAYRRQICAKELETCRETSDHAAPAFRCAREVGGRADLLPRDSAEFASPLSTTQLQIRIEPA